MASQESSYVSGETLNATDPVLSAVREGGRGTMIAKRAADRTWNLDLRLQGEGETVWLAV